MEKKKSLQGAIADWEKEHEGEKLSDAEWVDLIFRGINELDSNSLAYIKNCKKLSLSSNFITKIPDLHFPWRNHILCRSFHRSIERIQQPG